MNFTREGHPIERRPLGEPAESTREARGYRVVRIVCSILPVVIFFVVYTVTSLGPALFAAIGVALVILGWRLVTGRERRHAVFGLFGVGISAFIANSIGDAKGFFLLGIWGSAVLCAVFTLSVLAGWPLVGVIRHGITRDGQRWRSNRPLLRVYTLTTLLCAALLGVRFGLEQWLYVTDQTGWLAASHVATGLALPALAILATLLLARRACISP